MEINEWGRGGGAREGIVACDTTCSQSVLVDLTEGYSDVQQINKIKTSQLSGPDRVSHLLSFPYVLTSFSVWIFFHCFVCFTY